MASSFKDNAANDYTGLVCGWASREFRPGPVCSAAESRQFSGMATQKITVTLDDDQVLEIRILVAAALFAWNFILQK